MSQTSLNAYVIIATKGRAAVVHELLTWLQNQTLAPTHVVVVGSEARDVTNLDQHPSVLEGKATVKVATHAGSSHQRNVGVEVAKQFGLLGEVPSFAVFMDDDFRPDGTWLEAAQKKFQSQPDVVGITGHVLADGAQGTPLDTPDALVYLRGQKPPEPHWASGATDRPMESLFGCNMAFRDTAIRQCEFDEALPLYGWQEDQDYSSQASRWGRNIYTPDCRGVHLGSKSGRTSGLRFGYSQIANPLYLIKKGTMSKRKAYKFIARHLAANTVKSIGRFRYPNVDYPGRLRGNVRALLDLASGRCDPRRILEFV
ncbi:glycosyltransferase family 2 protein [Aquabacterium sp.]|uniref:glycosyltransferase family 2 protein n=1 Tax=Aquabacterium sp. TaxID=1872578 RepID=UPI003D6D7F77